MKINGFTVFNIIQWKRRYNIVQVILDILVRENM